jgi:hypothetical protein
MIFGRKADIEYQQRLEKIATVTFSESMRPLIEEEIVLLQPYLDNKDLIRPPYQWESSLIRSDVKTIKGYITKHYPDFINSEHYYHYNMGNIELFFPYDMAFYIVGFHAHNDNLSEETTECTNTLEVVFTKSYAIVIKINSYDILQAALDLPVRKYNQLEEFWCTGKFNPIKLREEEKNSEIFTQMIEKESEKEPDFEILQKREENQFEAANRDRSNSGKLMIFYFIFGLVGLLALEYFQSIMLGIFSSICFILAVIASFKKQKLPIRYVNHIKTKITTDVQGYYGLCLDGEFYIGFPEYWSIFIKKTDEPIDMQVEIKSQELLSCGEYLSISEEVRNYGAPKFVRHNVLLFITGSILSVLIFFFTDAGDKFDFTYQQLTSPDITQWDINDKVSFKKSAIKSMDRVNLDLSSVSCDIQNTINTRINFECNNIFININPIASSKLNISSLWPESIQKIYRGHIIKVIDDVDVMLMNFRIKNQKNNEEITKYGKIKSPSIVMMKIDNIGNSILTIDDSCNRFNLEPCDQIKSSLAALLPSDSHIDLNNWSEVTTYAKSHKKIQKIVKSDVVYSIIKLTTLYRDNLLKYFINDAKEKLKILQSDKNNISIQLTNNKLIRLLEYSYSDAYDALSLRRQLDYYNDILLGNRANLKISGIVKNVSYHNGEVSQLLLETDPIYNIDKKQLLSFSSPILINNFVFLFVILVALINGILFIWKKAFNELRLEKIIRNYEDKFFQYTDYDE